MCGIVGIWSNSKKSAFSEDYLRETLITMRNSQSHRGPDSVGSSINNELNLYLGFCRLSFQDLSINGNQPMEGSRWIVLFNGEIYNFKELKVKLKNSTFVFKSDSDTEVILAQLEIYGIESIRSLDGMYAIAAFDKKEQKLHLFRDAFGEKPLYYLYDNKTNIFAFSSELSGLEQSNLVDLYIDKLSVRKYFLFQYIPPPETIYKNIFKLLPGEHIEIGKNGSIKSENFTSLFQPTDIYSIENSLPPHKIKSDIIDLLSKSIERRLLSDVPIGAFLSSGVDSSLVVSIIKKTFGLDVQTFSVGFDNSSESEHFVATEIAKKLGTKHHNLILNPDGISILEELGRILDEPLADSSCFPTYMISKFARTHVKGIITGDGGDELFGGYPRYISAYDESIARGSANPWKIYQPLISISDNSFNSLFFPSLNPNFEIYMHDIETKFSQYKINRGFSAAMRFYDSKNYLPGAVLAKVDRMSMANSLETRTPFLEKDLAQLASKIPHFYLFGGGNTKFILREVLSNFLPEEISKLPKRGFGFPLNEAWLETLKNKIEKLNSESSNISKILGNEVATTLYRYLNEFGKANPYLIWAAVLLEEWLDNRKHIITELKDQEIVDSLKSNIEINEVYFNALIVPVERNFYLIKEIDAICRFYIFTYFFRLKIVQIILKMFQIKFQIYFSSNLRSESNAIKHSYIKLVYDPFRNTEILEFHGIKRYILAARFVIYLNKVYPLFRKFLALLHMIKLFSLKINDSMSIVGEKRIILGIHSHYFIAKVNNLQSNEVIEKIKDIDTSLPLSVNDIDRLNQIGFSTLDLNVIRTKNINRIQHELLNNKFILGIYKLLASLNINNFIFLKKFDEDSENVVDEVWFIEHCTSLPLIVSHWVEGVRYFRIIGKDSSLFDLQNLIEKFVLIRKVYAYYLQGVQLKRRLA